MNGYRRHEIARKGLALVAWLQHGEGPWVVFQHGLCGDARQPAEVFPATERVRHAVLECRGHGASPAGDFAALSIRTFTDDLGALLEDLGGNPVIVGGISMGAAIALRLACTRPGLVSGLILARPAWLAASAPRNMRPNLEVGRLLLRSATTGELDAFVASPTGRRVAELAPDNLASLTGFFAREPRAVTAALLTRISADGPGVTEEQIRALRIPTLVLGHEQDLVHPIAHARSLAGMIAGARFAELPPKSGDLLAYRDAFRHELAAFIGKTAHAIAR